jgi:hypothetical protein
MVAAMHNIRESWARMVCCVLHCLGDTLRADGEPLQFQRFLHIAYLSLCRPASSVAVGLVLSVSDIVQIVICH